MEQELEQTISEHLRSRLTHGVAPLVTRQVTANPLAYQYYLNGLHFLREEHVRENAQKSLDYFDRAVTVDPRFAVAWAGIARAHLSFAGNSYVEPRGVLPIAKTAAQRALALDDTLAEAHVALALVKQAEWDWAGTEQEYRRAIALNPNDVEGHVWYAWYLSAMGRHDEALRELRRAQALDPLRVRLKYFEGSMLTVAGRGREAIEHMRNAAASDSSEGFPHFQLGLAYNSIGLFDRAVEEIRASLARSGESTSRLCYYGYALAMAGQRHEAEGVARRLETTRDYVSPAELAVLYGALGQKAKALAMLEKAHGNHDLQLIFLKTDPHYAPIRSEPQFTGLIRRVGL